MRLRCDDRIRRGLEPDVDRHYSGHCYTGGVIMIVFR